MIKRLIYISRRHHHNAPHDLFRPLIEHGYEGIKFLRTSLDIETSDQSSEQSEELKSICSNFEDVSVTIGYGSGVFKQAGYEKAKLPQIDLIHIVENTETFHTKNLKKFPDHYSALKYGGVRLIEFFQNIGVGLYYNPFVQINNRTIKYGVMSRELALRDLVEWKNLYLAGRLQKPVVFLNDSTNLLQTVNQYNLTNAVIVSLLMLDSNDVPKQKLFETVTLLSYLGDPRMSVGGENPDKIKNIVAKQEAALDRLYSPILSNLESCKYISVHGGRVRKLFGTQEQAALINRLPKNFRRILNETVGSTSTVSAAEIVNTLKKIVRKPSLIQSIKGVFTAGIYKSIVYMIEKRSKYVQNYHKNNR